MTAFLLVAAGGFWGAVTRYGISSWIGTKYRGSFPWGTFVVNLTGSFALGLLLGWLQLPPQIFWAAGVGFLGSYTTFSTFELEAAELIRNKKVAVSVLYLLLSTVLGFLLAATGYLIAAGLS